MRRSFVLLFLAAGLSSLPAQPASAPSPAAESLPTDVSALISPATVIKDPASDPEWSELVRKLAPNKTRQSAFEERRYFPFRKTPVVLTGEIRIVPELGLSLRYLTPDARVLIIDDKGLLMRDVDGRERTPPSDSRAQAATSAMVHVLRFDLTSLQKDFEVHGRKQGKTWTLGFVPRDATFANLLGTLVVSGDDTTLSRIEMIKSATQRIEIAIRDTREDVLFTGDTLRRFFR